MLKLKIDDKEIKMPTSWLETTFRQYVEIVTGKSDFWWGLSVITNVPYETLMKYNFSEGMDTIVHAASFLNKWEGIDEYPKKCGPYLLGDSITTGNQLTAITQEIEMVGQSKDMGEQLQQLCTIAAIYCQGVYEPFDKEKAFYLSKQFQEYPCIDVLSCGNYFQAKAIAIASGGKVTVESLRKMADPPVLFRTKKKSFLQRLWR